MIICATVSLQKMSLGDIGHLEMITRFEWLSLRRFLSYHLTVLIDLLVKNLPTPSFCSSTKFFFLVCSLPCSPLPPSFSHLSLSLSSSFFLLQLFLRTWRHTWGLETAAGLIRCSGVSRGVFISYQPASTTTLEILQIIRSLRIADRMLATWYSK